MVRLWSKKINDTFRISFCEVAKHVGQLRINFETIKKSHFYQCPPLLNEEWFPMDYTSDFFDVLCSPRRSPNDDGNSNRERSWFEVMWRENYNNEE